MDHAPGRLYHFADFTLDTRRLELRQGNGEAIALTAKAFDTLHTLIERRDRIVSKEELMAAVWSGRIVEENNLSQAISVLRRALGTDVSEHRYIVTVPGRGYRFVADVTEGSHPSSASPPDTDAKSSVPGQEQSARSAAPPPTPILAERRRASDGPRRAVVLGALLFMLVLFAIVAWQQRGPAETALSRIAVTGTTLAVLPFRSLSDGPRDELLEMGLAETLVTRLGRSAALRVHSMASVRRLANDSADALAVARELGASYIVEGTTQRVGNTMRVNVRLWSVEDGDIAMSQTFDARIDRVFTLQDAIGDAVTTALEVRPLTLPARAASPCEGDDAGAFRALLRAHYMLHRRAPDTIAAFHEAIRRDPSCGRAYAGLATSYLFLAHNDAPPDEVFLLAKGAVRQALEVDPDSAEAHLAHGRYLQLHDWDWLGAEKAMKRAIDRNPSLADAHSGLAHLMVTTGRFDKGLDHSRQASELDPLSPFINSMGGGFLSAAGQPDAARKRLQRALELEPDFWIALSVRGGLALDRGEFEAAVADLQRAAEGSRRASQILAVLAAAEVAAGRRAKAEAILRELQQREAAGYVPPTSLAAVHNALGDTDAALDQLERAYAAHDIRIGFIKVDARWNNLRDQPRFRALAAKLGLQGGSATGRY